MAQLWINGEKVGNPWPYGDGVFWGGVTNLLKEMARLEIIKLNNIYEQADGTKYFADWNDSTKTAKYSISVKVSEKVGEEKNILKDITLIFDTINGTNVVKAVTTPLSPSVGITDFKDEYFYIPGCDFGLHEKDQRIEVNLAKIKEIFDLIGIEFGSWEVIDPDANSSVKKYVADSKANWTFAGSKATAEANMTTISFNAWRINDKGEKETHTRSITVYKGISDQVKKIFNEIYADPIKFPIKEAGGFRWSSGDFKNGKIYYEAHPTGTGIDINPNENYMPGVAGSFWKPNDNPYSMPADGIVVKTFKKYGWGWGGDFKSTKDYMHFSVTGK